MAEVGRKRRQTLFNILSGAIPIHESPHGEAVPQVMHAGPGSITWMTQANLAADSSEGAGEFGFVEGSTVSGQEEV